MLKALSTPPSSTITFASGTNTDNALIKFNDGALKLLREKSALKSRFIRTHDATIKG